MPTDQRRRGERIVATIEIAGLRVEHAPGNGPKVLFVHGSGAGAWCWENFLPWFAAAGYDCYALNLRGHGPNPPLPDLGRVRLLDYVGDVRAVLAELGEDVILIGHSMGGAIAQVVGERAALKALVLAATAPVAGVKFQVPPGNLWYLLHMLRTLPALLRKKPIPLGWRVMKSAALNKIPAEHQRELYERFQPESGTVGMEILNGDVGADLSRAAFPILVISGDEDRTSVIAMEREIAAQHKADLIELPGYGHMFMLEPGWEAAAQKILDWLRSKGLAAER